MLLNNNLETSRLIIRSWKRTDTDFTLNLWGDRENGKYMSDPARKIRMKIIFKLLRRWRIIRTDII